MQVNVLNGSHIRSGKSRRRFHSNSNKNAARKALRGQPTPLYTSCYARLL